MTDREQIEDFLRLVLAAANQIQKLIPDFRGVVEADDFSMSDLLRLQPAFSGVAPLCIEVETSEIHIRTRCCKVPRDVEQGRC